MNLLKLIVIISLLTSLSFAQIIIGKVKVKGNSPNTSIIIEEDGTGKNYKVANPQDFNLLYIQNAKLKIEAKIIQKAAGPGFPAVIKIISIQTNK